MVLYKCYLFRWHNFIIIPLCDVIKKKIFTDLLFALNMVIFSGPAKARLRPANTHPMRWHHNIIHNKNNINGIFLFSMIRKKSGVIFFFTVTKRNATENSE